MPKYSSEERESLAVAGKRLGLGERDSKIADLRDRATRAATKAGQQNVKPPKRQKRHHEMEVETLDRKIEQCKLKHLPKAEQIQTYDVTKPTRYPEVVLCDTSGGVMLDKVLKRYAYVMKPHGITPADFKMWREHFMLMTPEQLGALVRVAGKTVRNWENGVSAIPFSMWWVMHVTMQDPEYFLTRPGFHDFYIEYTDGKAHLCSHSYPDIRWTATDLYFNRCALNEVFFLRNEIEKHLEKLQELEAENTRLRQMLKADGVTAELQAMQDHIGDLMKRIHTADVMPFEAKPEVISEAPAVHKAA
jgi:DNA-binding transcriptional regulator YiaG